MSDKRTPKEIRITGDKVCEILQRTNDGDLLDPGHLKLTEHAINGFLSELGEKAFEELYQSVIGGTYTKPYLHGIEHMSRDYDGYIYYKDIQVEHYDHDYVSSENAKNNLIEIKRRCEFLESRGVEVSCSNAIWKWDNYADDYGAEKLKEMDALIGNELKGFQYTKVELHNSCRNFEYFVCGKPKNLEEIKNHPVTQSMIGRYFDNEFSIKAETFIYGKRLSNNLVTILANKAEIESLLVPCHDYLKKHDKLVQQTEIHTYKTDFAEGYESVEALNNLLNSPGRSLEYSTIMLWGQHGPVNLCVCGKPTLDEVMEYPDSRVLAKLSGNDFSIIVNTFSYGNGEPLTNEEIQNQTEIVAFLETTHNYLKSHDLIEETDWNRYKPEYELNKHGFAEFGNEQEYGNEDEDEYEP